MQDKFLIVDGNSLLYRAFHALPLMDHEGTYTNAIHGFLSMFLTVLREEGARYAAVCFDEHGPTFRHTVYPEYKAGRAPAPPELIQQMATIRTLLDQMHIRRFGLQGWEADDLLGTLSLQAQAQDITCVLLTGDRDALQLVGGGTELLFTRKGISETIRFTPASVFEEYGFTPEQVTDWKGLAGDSSDNIPGIAGIGDKTAVKLLQKYGTLEEILAHAGEEKGKLGERLQSGRDIARRCKELATIRRDAPVIFSRGECAVPDLLQAIPALQALGLNQLIRRITKDAGQEAPAETAVPASAIRPELPVFETVDVHEAEALSAFLATLTDSSDPCAVFIGDTHASLAASDGRALRVPLGGDLLTPGLSPEEFLSALAPFMQTRAFIVHDGKALLHRMDRLRLPLPCAFAWDTMLGAYVLDPQTDSYDLRDLFPGQEEDARAVFALARSQMAQTEAAGMTRLMAEI